MLLNSKIKKMMMIGLSTALVFTFNSGAFAKAPSKPKSLSATSEVYGQLGEQALPKPNNQIEKEKGALEKKEQIKLNQEAKKEAMKKAQEIKQEQLKKIREKNQELAKKRQEQFQQELKAKQEKYKAQLDEVKQQKNKQLNAMAEKITKLQEAKKESNQATQEKAKQLQALKKEQSELKPLQKIQPQLQNKGLSDLQKHWASGTIYQLHQLGVISGYADGKFYPNKPVTQGEAVVMITRLLKLPVTKTVYANKEDKIPTWLEASLNAAKNEGLIKPNQEIKPNAAATRIFVTRLLVNAIGEEFNGDFDKANDYFSDVKSLDKNAQADIAYAAILQLVKGYDGKKFLPQRAVTRAEMATMLKRVHDILKKKAPSIKPTPPQKEKVETPNDSVTTNVY